LILLAGVLPLPAFGAGVVGSGTAESCTEAAPDAALGGGGLVTFDCGAEPVTITLSAEKVISSETIVDGGGRITLSGGNAVRVFSVNAGATLEVRHLTVANGAKSDGGGGGALNEGVLIVTDSTFSDNMAYVGGGIYNDGTLSVANSTFSGNGFALGGGNIEGWTGDVVPFGLGLASAVSLRTAATWRRRRTWSSSPSTTASESSAFSRTPPSRPRTRRTPATKGCSISARRSSG
jgi:hypothetical protein